VLEKLGGVGSLERTRLQWKFPVIREFNREFHDFGPSPAKPVAENACAAGISYAIPYER
jgi:hypothetical protein